MKKSLSIIAGFQESLGFPIVPKAYAKIKPCAATTGYESWLILPMLGVAVKFNLK
jgi:hypothetical protein